MIVSIIDAVKSDLQAAGFNVPATLPPSIEEADLPMALVKPGAGRIQHKSNALGKQRMELKQCGSNR